MPEYPLLSQVNVTRPCPARWAAMTGGDAKRFCESCNKHVHNLSHGTAAQAEALLRRTGGDVCVRYYQDKEGRIVTRPEAPFFARFAALLVRCRHAAASLALLLAGLVLPGCGTSQQDVTLPERVAYTPPEPPGDEFFGLGEQPDGSVIIGDPGIHVESTPKPPHLQGTKGPR